jgi:hypothetical protein
VTTPRGRAIIATAAAMTAVLATVVFLASQRLHRADSELASPREDTLGEGPTMQVLTNGHLSLVSRDHPDGPRTISSIACDRAYAAAGTVACLRPVDSLSHTELVVLDSQLHELRSVPLTGFPSRATVSPSGRMIAWTLYVEGHSPAEAGASTSTGILDTRTGTLIPPLEKFAVVKDGNRYEGTDANVSCVTFADDNRFYASMWTDDRRYLVEGDIAAGQVRTIAENIECPSLSPDGTRIAFIHTNGIAGPIGQGHAGHDGPEITRQLSILELGTLRTTHLAETRSVDDQAIWLDNDTVAYGLQRPDGVNDVWAVPADGTGATRLLIPEANSPAPLQ